MKALPFGLSLFLAIALGLPTAWMIDDWRIRILETQPNGDF